MKLRWNEQAKLRDAEIVAYHMRQGRTREFAENFLDGLRRSYDRAGNKLPPTYSWPVPGSRVPQLQIVFFKTEKE